jgi:purine-nucleoside phosphorylase
MATPHIDAKPGEIAERVLLPGDPLRAKFIAENFLEDAVCYNTVRGMYGYTGTYKGKKVSVQGTGMGVPSISIYTHELINHFGCKRLMRIGSCGSLQPELKLRDVVIAMAASTDSAINDRRFQGRTFAPTASEQMLFSAWEKAQELGIKAKAGNILTADTFYEDDAEDWKIWAEYGILAVEMEAAALYTLAAKYKVEALTLLTVSDSFITGEKSSPEERQIGFKQMMQLALETI